LIDPPVGPCGVHGEVGGRRDLEVGLADEPVGLGPECQRRRMPQGNGLRMDQPQTLAAYFAGWAADRPDTDGGDVAGACANREVAIPVANRIVINDVKVFMVACCQ